MTKSEDKDPWAAQTEERIVRLAKLSELVLAEATERVGGHAVLPDGTAVFVPLGDAIDVARECDRLGAEAGVVVPEMLEAVVQVHVRRVHGKGRIVIRDRRGDQRMLQRGGGQPHR